MNYLKIYNLIIEKALSRDKLIICEKHHVIPKSIRKTKVAIELLQRDLLVELTLREHFVAHLLLVKIFQTIDTNCYQRMLFAANMLRTRTKNGLEYHWLKEKFRKMMSDHLKGKPSRAKGKKWSEISKQLRSTNHYMKGKTYEEIYGEKEGKRLRESRGKSRIGKKLEEILKDPNQADRIRAIYKRPRTLEWRQKISDSKKGIPISEETKEKISVFFRNDLKNPFVNQTLYRFENIKTGEIIIARQIDMKRQYKCCLMHRIMRDKTKTSRGWRFIGLAKENKNE